MKKAASVFSWLGGLFTVVISFIFFIRGYKVEHLGYYEAYPPYVWIIWGIYIVVMLAVLVWRQFSVEFGHKIACGILTIVFVSKIGGILTLCIPKSQLNGDDDEETISKDTDVSLKRTKKEITNEEVKINLILKYKEMLDNGIITQEEFEKKKKELI